MTEKLYLTDSYAKEFEATVQKVDGRFVVLDKTCFYPEGGGQPSDTGKLVRENKEFKVVFAKNLGKDVSLEVDKEGLKEGDKVKAELDWEKRYKLMRMHTAAHILNQILFKELTAMVTGNQLGTEKSRMDISVEEFDRERFKEFEKKANEIVEQGLPVTTSFLPVEQALKDPELVRLKDIMPKALKEWRIVSIGGFDKQADGGTHVKNTGEIGKIKITKLENKGANNRRIYFELE